MTEVFTSLITWIWNIAEGVLGRTVFELGGYQVDLLSIFVVLIFIYMFAYVWWKGAKG